MNRKRIFNITGTGKEFRIEIDENNLMREKNTSSSIAKNTFQKTILSLILIDDDIINSRREQTYSANVEETFFVEVKFLFIM